MTEELQVEKPSAIIVFIKTEHAGQDDLEYMQEELENLVVACDMEVAAIFSQALARPNPGTYIGSGKLLELASLAANMEADYVIFSESLSPSQLKNIQRALDDDPISKGQTSTLDRTSLILEIFAKRARTREARLQVEYANLQYMLPRLVGMRASLGRQGGASGSMSNKGQGEKQIELDRRHIEQRMSELRRELDLIEHDRDVQRKKRSRSSIPLVSLVGYTNAGKSTVMNRLMNISGASEEKLVFEKNMLFATLDTTVRRVTTGDRKDFLLSDTVGFVSNLPHQLVKAFRSTLEEVKYAALLLIVIDESDEHSAEHVKITEDTLSEIDACDIPRIYVHNKIDRLGMDVIEHSMDKRDEKHIYISASMGIGIDELIATIKEIVYGANKVIDMLIPYSRGDLVTLLNENAHVISQDYEESGYRISADCPPHIYGKIDEAFIM